MIQLLFRFYSTIFFILSLFIIACLFFGCARTIPKTKSQAYFRPVTFSQLSEWSQDDHYAALLTFGNSCKALLKRDPCSQMKPVGTAKSWHRVCHQALTIIKYKKDTKAKEFFENYFIPYEVQDHNKSPIGKFTGYYEVELEGKKKPDRNFKYPIYSPPHNINLIKGRNHIKHKAINNGSLSKRGLEIVWVNNIARLYALHLQGSGIVKLPNGQYIRLSYADNNGFKYKGLNECLKAAGMTNNYAGNILDMENKDHQSILKIIEQNHSYVFFQIKNSRPIGAQGVEIRPTRSIAIDSNIYSYGLPFWLDINGPIKEGKIKRLCIAQDRGGAIKGPIRADLFLGRGKVAEKVASALNHSGKYYLLIPKGIRMPKKI